MSPAEGALEDSVEAIRNTLEMWLEKNTAHDEYRADIRDILKTIGDEADALFKMSPSGEERAQLLNIADDCLDRLQRKSAKYHITALRTCVTRMTDFKSKMEQRNISIKVGSTSPCPSAPFEGPAADEDLLGDNEVPGNKVDHHDEPPPSQAPERQLSCSPEPEVSTVPESADRSQSEETDIWRTSVSARDETGEQSDSDDELGLGDIGRNSHHETAVKVKQEPASPSSPNISWSPPPPYISWSPSDSEMDTAGPSLPGIQPRDHAHQEPPSAVNPPPQPRQPAPQASSVSQVGRSSRPPSTSASSRCRPGCYLCKTGQAGCKDRNAVYKITCMSCKASCVGETSGRLGTVINTRMRSMENHPGRDTGIGRHVALCHKTSRPYFKVTILALIEDKSERRKKKREESKKVKYRQNNPPWIPKLPLTNTGQAGTGSDISNTAVQSQLSAAQARIGSADVSITAVPSQHRHSAAQNQTRSDNLSITAVPTKSAYSDSDSDNLGDMM